MPFSLTRADRKMLLIAAGVLAILMLAALILAPPTELEERAPTTYSTSSEGAKAAYLLLKETGYRVERWERSPADLPSGAGHVLILAQPGSLPTSEERVRLHRFVLDGGRLIATGFLAATLLPQNSSTPNPLGAGEWQRYRPLLPSGLARAAGEISLEPQAFWDSNAEAVPLYGNKEKAVVVKYQYGRGEVLWWASATPLTNAGLQEAANLDFFLATIGDKRATRVLWDEYFHGRRPLTSTAGSRQVKWLLAQLALLALAVLATFSRRGGPVRAPAPEKRLSPLEFVETLGGLYQRAHANAVAVDVYYRRFRHLLTRRLGTAGDLSPEALEHAVRERWGLPSPDFLATLKSCEAARFYPELSGSEALRLVRTLYGYALKLKLFPLPAEEKR